MAKKKRSKASAERISSSTIAEVGSDGKTVTNVIHEGPPHMMSWEQFRLFMNIAWQDVLAENTTKQQEAKFAKWLGLSNKSRLTALEPIPGAGPARLFFLSLPMPI